MPSRQTTRKLCRLTRFNKPQLVAATTITKIPITSLVKGDDGRPATDYQGTLTEETETRLCRLRFHLGKLTLQHPSGAVSTITHTARPIPATRTSPATVAHKVTWQNSFGYKREFYHPHNLADFLVGKYGIRLTTRILQTIEQLSITPEQGSR